MAFSVFKKKNKKENSDNRFMTLKVSEVRQLAKDSVSLVFEQPANFSYESGQFITLIEHVNGKKLRRAYSLHSSPVVDDAPAIAIKRVNDGAMSNHINDSFQAGQEVEIMEPMGRFTTTYDAAGQRNIIMFAGGSGITPLYSLTKSILHLEPSSEITLIFANRSEDYIMFRKELEQLKENSDRFRLVHVLEEDPNKLAAHEGRFNPNLVNTLLDNLFVTDQTEYYICGPQPMMDIIKTGLSLRRIPEEQIRMESFEAGVTSPKEIIDTAGNKTSSVTILLNGEETTLELQKDQPVLTQGLDAGLDMPYSCQSGLCTACRGQVIEGEVTTDQADGLSQEELDEGYVLCCVGRPVSDDVKIEIG
jgi:ring-1,2-phenylacetyl-CoA epoxidase subunit PaaE